MSDHISREAAFNAISDSEAYFPIVLPSTQAKLLSDGTLIVPVPKGTEVTRVMVDEAGTQFCGLFYPEGGEDERRDK